MVVDWEQETGLLMSSGDVRIVRIWDTEREMKVQVTAPAALERQCLWTLSLGTPQQEHVREPCSSGSSENILNQDVHVLLKVPFVRFS